MPIAVALPVKTLLKPAKVEVLLKIGGVMGVERDEGRGCSQNDGDGNPISLLVEFRRKEPDLRLVVYDVWNNPPERYGPLVGRNRLWRGRGLVGVRIRGIHLCSQHG